ncbi:hypothetical protein B0T26DRAFT_731081 [Lasiosphaeria miniovina]|uniref:Uncharacterized protein n=1 Tax=Lasiosphaeria miniovina TaxID=1954250 RepID=A0AA39ZTI3_9PEZI|nr:uncharacterized protein B0T26DRAFT_731081 [Lasiosphaeria miniovina]KAK0703363.1 hypothetical protein B0T26DRAFT_731081 [Lasiosphaeria miniovina]
MASRDDSLSDDNPFYLTPDLPAREPAPPARPRDDISCLWDKLRPSEAHSCKTDTIKRDCCFKAVATALAANNRLPHLEVY